MTSKQPVPVNLKKSKPGRLIVRLLIIVILFVVVTQLWFSLRTENRYHISPSVNTLPGADDLIPSGVHPLGLGGWRWVNREFWWRDGTLVVPKSIPLGQPKPLLIWMHGGGGKADDFKDVYPLAEHFGVVILSLDARHNTWDGIDSPFGPDVKFINRALDHVFSKVAIDRSKIALGGISDGASYALALGRSNGELFTHVIGVAPWFLSPPGPRIGTPKIYIAHGKRDNVYPLKVTEKIIVPLLRQQDYTVDFLVFDGPHWVPVEVAEKILHWFIN